MQPPTVGKRLNKIKGRKCLKWGNRSRHTSEKMGAARAMPKLTWEVEEESCFPTIQGGVQVLVRGNREGWTASGVSSSVQMYVHTHTHREKTRIHAQAHKHTCIAHTETYTHKAHSLIRTHSIFTEKTHKHTYSTYTERKHRLTHTHTLKSSDLLRLVDCHK